MLLKHYLASGLSKTAIADQLGISRRLVYHLIATGQLDRELGADATPRTRGIAGVAKLATVTPLLAARLATYPALSAVRLFAECRAAGYTGGYSQLTALVRRLRPVPEPEVVVRFETVRIAVMSITCFGRSRSPVSVQSDHSFRSKAITCFGRRRSLV